MAKSNALLRETDSKFVPVKDLDSLDPFLNRTFVRRKNGQTTAVKIVKVKGTKVQLKAAHEERQDSKTISMQEFTKFYELVP
jgi:hypothetical protein